MDLNDTLGRPSTNTLTSLLVLRAVMCKGVIKIYVNSQNFYVKM